VAEQEEEEDEEEEEEIEIKDLTFVIELSGLTVYFGRETGRRLTNLQNEEVEER
jgi:hypothetical protein